MAWKQKFAITISVLTIVFGVVLTVIWFAWSVIDYKALNEAWVHLMDLSKTPGVSTQKLLVANSSQSAHRVNMLAEIVGMMIGALIAAVGGLGLVICLTRPKDTP